MPNISIQPLHTLRSSDLTIIKEAELKKISSLTQHHQCLALFKIKEPELPKLHGLKLALDDVRDPGNLGTIIRLCDWFGIQNLVCSETSVDCFNPKVIQATMGSIARVNIHYLGLKEFLTNSPLPVYGTFMTGTNLYETSLPDKGILVMGNEANG